jgi:tetratricopeptide (TPR) repeat protein
MKILDSYHVHEYLYCSFVDSDGINIGQIDDLILSNVTFRIKKFLLTQLITTGKVITVDWNEIESQFFDKNVSNQIIVNKVFKELIQQKKSDTLNKDEILFSDLKKFTIFDKLGKILDQKIVDIYYSKNNEFSLITNRSFLIHETYIRTIQLDQRSLTTMLSEKQLSTFKHEELEHIKIQLANLSSEIPDFNLLDNILDMGYSHEVLITLQNLEANIEDSTINFNILYLKGKILIYLGDFAGALDIFNTLKTNASGKLLGKVKIELGKYYLKIGDYQTSKTLLEEARAYFKIQKDELYQSLSLNWLGLCYFNNGNIKQAFEEFEKAKLLAKQIKNPRAEAFSLNNLGIIYRLQGKIDHAINIFEEAIDLVKDSSFRSLSLLLRNQALAHFQTGNQGKSLELHFDALALRKKFGNVLEISESLLDIAIVENSIGREISILKFFPDNIHNIQLITDYKSIIIGINEKTKNKGHSQAIILWSNVLKSGLIGLEYQVQVFEYIIESMIILWIEDGYNDSSLIEISKKMQFGLKLTEKNYLISYHCKLLIGLAKIEVYNRSFTNAMNYYKQALKISTEQNLFTHRDIIEKDLYDFDSIKIAFTTKKDEELIIIKKKWINEILFYLRYLKSYYIF